MSRGFRVIRGLSLGGSELIAGEAGARSARTNLKLYRPRRRLRSLTSHFGVGIINGAYLAARRPATGGSSEEAIVKKFVTEDSFWELFPESVIGIVVAEGMKGASEVSEADRAELERLLDRANVLAERHLASDTISENAPVKAWREAYRAFKTKKGARCSIENLLKRVLKGRPVGPITPSVDIYNAISLKYALPVGGEDIDAFAGDLRLGITEGGDAFLPLGEDEHDDPTLPGELCYRDDEGAVCRCWNWRDGVRTALADDSRNAFLIIECVEPGRTDDCRAAIDELAELVERYLGAHIKVKELVTAENREVVIAD